MSAKIVPVTVIEEVGKVLSSKDRPLKERFRALFTLKGLGGDAAICAIARCFDDPSALLKHELAYCLGQMKDPSAVPHLCKVLQDTTQEPMVRHEAAEALGAIGIPEVREILEEFSKDPVIDVAETCQIALGRLKWLQKPDDKALSNNPYASVDPAPPSDIVDIPRLKTTLLDEKANLFDRYRAMFSLRNLHTNESVCALGEGLNGSSALFRHEIAFVLGQMQDEVSIPYLKNNLENTSENEMVRHECAEALGAIATPECIEILKKYLVDDKRVVKESCEIALDMCEYENSPEFQYADTAFKITETNQ